MRIKLLQKYILPFSHFHLVVLLVGCLLFGTEHTECSSLFCCEFCKQNAFIQTQRATFVQLYSLYLYLYRRRRWCCYCYCRRREFAPHITVSQWEQFQPVSGIQLWLCSIFATLLFFLVIPSASSFHIIWILSNCRGDAAFPDFVRMKISMHFFEICSKICVCFQLVSQRFSRNRMH